MIYLELSEVGFFEIFKGIILPLLTVFGLEIVYRSTLLEMSKSSVPEMQDDFEDADGVNEFFEWIVWLGGTKALCLLLTLSFMMMDKASSMYLWSTSIAMYFFANILESLYAQ